MFLEERQELIVRMVERDGKVKVKELSAKFKVTEDCIRKDLGSLERQGRLKRTYGGAVKLTQSIHMIEVSRHRHMDVEAKRRIAQAAVSLIRDKDMVFLDVSTSNLAIAELLMKSDRDLTVVTNMVDVLGVLARNPRIELIFAGGQINRGRDGFWGKRSYVLAAARKLSTDGNYDYAPLNALAGFVTDTEPPSDIRAAAAELGVDIVLP